jgi:hypothetical protein
MQAGRSRRVCRDTGYFVTWFDVFRKELALQNISFDQGNNRKLGAVVTPG